jgi:hypothetical protein
MNELKKFFYVWNHHCRFLGDGTRLNPKKNESLIVTNVVYRYHRGQKFGTIFYGDGTFTKEFPVNNKNLSDLAKKAKDFCIWYEGRNAAMLRSQNEQQQGV